MHHDPFPRHLRLDTPRCHRASPKLQNVTSAFHLRDPARPTMCLCNRELRAFDRQPALHILFLTVTRDVLHQSSESVTASSEDTIRCFEHAKDVRISSLNPHFPARCLSHCHGCNRILSLRRRVSPHSSVYPLSSPYRVLPRLPATRADYQRRRSIPLPCHRPLRHTDLSVRQSSTLEWSEARFGSANRNRFERYRSAVSFTSRRLLQELPTMMHINSHSQKAPQMPTERAANRCPKCKQRSRLL